MLHRDRTVFSEVPAIIELLDARRLLSGDAVTPGSETQVISGVNNQIAPKIATDPAGDYVVVWENNGQNGGQAGIFAQRYNADGTPQGSNFKVNSDLSTADVDPSVAMDEAGNFAIAWASISPGGSESSIDAQRYNEAGTALGSEFLVSTGAATIIQQFPSVAMDAAGDFVITWDSQILNVGSNIDAQRYSALGMAERGEFQVNSSLLSAAVQPAVAIDGAGDFVMVWESLGQNGNSTGIDARRYNSAGIAQGPEFQVSADAEGNQMSQSVAMDTAGDFVIAWQGVEDGRFQVFVQPFDAAGIAQGAPLQVNHDPTGESLAPSVGMDEAGGFVVAWQTDPQQGGHLVVDLQRFNSQSIPQGSASQLNSLTTANAVFPAVAIDAAGVVVVTWENQSKGNGRYTIETQTLGTSGAAQGEEVQVNLGNSNIPTPNPGQDFATPASDFLQYSNLNGVYAQYYAVAAPVADMSRSPDLMQFNAELDSWDSDGWGALEAVRDAESVAGGQ